MLAYRKLSSKIYSVFNAFIQSWLWDDISGRNRLSIQTETVYLLKLKDDFYPSSPAAEMEQNTLLHISICQLHVSFQQRKE